MHNLLKILLCILLVVSTHQQCAQTTQNDLLQSGSTFFFNSNAGSTLREHLYTFPLSYTPPSGALQVAVSTSNFQISSNSGVNFEIVGNVGTTSSYCVVGMLLGEDSSWTSVRVYYLVSSRADFFLGTFSAGLYLLQKYAPGNTLSVSYVLGGWTASQQSFTAVVQLSGVRTTASSFSIGLGAASFNASTGQLITQLALTSSPPIESISITYIIFQNNAPFVYSSFDSMTGSDATYQFIGISQLSNTATSYTGSGFVSTAATQGQLSCIGSNCPGQCITSQNCIANYGQISGANCLLCGNGQIAVNGGCSSQINCGSNQYYNGTDCVCYLGYLLVNSICYQGCGTNAYVINSQCQCLPGYAFSTLTYSCVKQSTPTCGANYVLVNNVCTCKSGFGLINNLCVSCPANSYVAANGNCVCNSGLTLDTNSLSCVTACYPNSYPNDKGQCICSSGYYNTGYSCIQNTNCINGQIWTGSACACPQGQVVDSITNQCTYCNTNDRMVSSGSCVCSPSYYPTSIGCSPCPANSQYNITASACVCVTGYYMLNSTCVMSANCPLNSNWNPVTLRCDCTYFQEYVINGYCQQCPLNSKWNGTACACNTGFVPVGTLCNCPYGQLWNGVNCICGGRKYLIGNVCTLCDINAVYNPTIQNCTCKDGYYGVYNLCTKCDKSCATCSGSLTNNCLTCSSGYKLVNGYCLSSSVCSSNGQYIDSNNNCQSCMANCIQCSDGVSCTTCAIGYKPALTISGNTVATICQLIPNGTSSTLTLRGQVTGNGVVYQGVGLSLMPTAILSKNCDICNSLLTVQVVSSFTSITTAVEYVNNSQYWFVITFNFGNSPFIPNFQYTVQINPLYATYFSSADMAQKLLGAYSQTSSSSSNLSTGVPKQNNIYTNAGNPTDSIQPRPNNTSNSHPAQTSPSSSNSSLSNSTSITKDSKTLISLFG